METYTVRFDQTNFNWDQNPTYNELFIRSTIQRFNDVLNIQGYVLLKDILEALSMELTKKSLTYGWERSNSFWVEFVLIPVENGFDIKFYQLKDITNHFKD